MDDFQRSESGMEETHPAYRLLHLLNPKGKNQLPLDDLVSPK